MVLTLSIRHRCSHRHSRQAVHEKKGELKSHICITVPYQWTWYMHLPYYKSHIPLPKEICAAISKHMSKKDVTHVHQHEQQEERLQGGVTAARNSDTPVQFRRMLNGGLISSLPMSSIMKRQNLPSLPRPIRDVCTCLFSPISCLRQPFASAAHLFPPLDSTMTSLD